MYNIITFLSVNMWNEKKTTIIKNDIIILCTNGEKLTNEKWKAGR